MWGSSPTSIPGVMLGLALAHPNMRFSRWIYFSVLSDSVLDQDDAPAPLNAATRK